MSFFTFSLRCVLILSASQQILSKYILDFHAVFSDSFSENFPADTFPVKGSYQYYTTLAHRDRVSHGRRLSSGDITHGILNFADGNETHRLSAFGFLNYAKISVGTPKKLFMVALDTGSDMMWLPCDCISCVRGLKMPSGPDIKLEIYSPRASTTSAVIPCKSRTCAQGERRCSDSAGKLDHCPYKVVYLSNGTSSTGFLVEDVLHLVSEDDSKSLDAHIIFGCGQIQTGIFVQGAAPNGLLGLGAAPISIPSTLASQGLISNSFSMCFGVDGTGRIVFGDEAGSNQGETPFTFQESNPIYNISVIGIQVGETTSDITFRAIFDSGTSFTYLNDPAYAHITESFDSQTPGRKTQQKRDIPFEFCYGLSESDTNFTAPNVVLKMRGGDEFTVMEPTMVVSAQGEYLFCLGLIRSGDINIIGQNFMAGYEMMFDRKRAILGWKESNCYDEPEMGRMRPIRPWNTSAISPAVAVDPQNSTGSQRHSSSSNLHFSVFCCVNFVVYLIHFLLSTASTYK